MAEPKTTDAPAKPEKPAIKWDDNAAPDPAKVPEPRIIRDADGNP